MTLKYKIYLEKFKIVRDYGVVELLSEQIINTLVLTLLNILIWTNVYCLVPPKLTLEYHNPSLVQTSDTVSEDRGEVIETAHAKEGNDSTLTPPKQPVDDSFPIGIEQMIAKTFPENPKEMIAIARAESGFNRFARNVNKNGTVDRGIFQVNSIHGFNEEWLTVTENNLVAARKIYDKQGLQAWSAYNNGSFSRYLTN